MRAAAGTAAAAITTSAGRGTIVVAVTFFWKPRLWLASPRQHAGRLDLRGRADPPKCEGRLQQSSRHSFAHATSTCYVTCNRGGALATAARSTSRDKVRAHRARLREQGLRPVQIWVPDVRRAAFTRAAHRQSLAVAQSPRVKADQAFVDAISAWDAE